MHVAEGELVCVVGRNGAGKSTLLRAISGVQPVFGGSIEFDGADVTRLASPKRVKSGIVQVPEGRQVFPEMTVEDNLRLGGYRRRSEISERLEKAFEMFPVLRERRDSAAGSLSGGQQQMLVVGRALMSRPRLLMLDEPSMGLAPQMVAQIFKTIQLLKNSGTTILLVEQNAAGALALADRGYVLETGQIALAGAGRELLKDPRVRRAYLGN
ncbi:MAG: ABC transporter ATP-binding protein [Rhizobiales bacterium]|nr:ABC transporter ATP-binding protein [Hyphomicrobiales bacterium]